MSAKGVTGRVAAKERRLFFSSAAGWLFLGAFAAATLFVFFWQEAFFARNIADVRPLFEWMPVILIFLCAALTMKMWSEERRTGTLEHILTQPISLWIFVLGKFRACFFLLVMALALTLPLPLTVAALANLDWGPVVAAYLATLFLGGAYLSIGLYVSAKTDNAMVALIATVASSGAVYLLGSSAIANSVEGNLAEILQLLGSGSRFESITRGVIDFRDIAYYCSITVIFLTLNTYALEKVGWSSKSTSGRHRQWRGVTFLIVLNIVLVNVWLAKLPTLRADLTEGKLYSISKATHQYLGQLQEPLLIRGYFSARTHSLLAPLIPQMRDLIQEYEVAGKGGVRVEFIDPANNANLEREANELYGIRATPFQISDRYQSSITNSYFNILIQYGNEFETLSFSDLVEIKAGSGTQPDVLLRNPEFDLTRAIKNVLYRYQQGGDLFDGIDESVEFIGYISAEEDLPQPLIAYKAAISKQLEALTSHSQGKFSFRFIEPEARNGVIAKQIEQQWGYKPMSSPDDPEKTFFFYLTLADKKQVVKLPTLNFSADSFNPLLSAGLRRFTSGFTKSVSLLTPPTDPRMAKYHLGAPTFKKLEREIGRDYNLRLDTLRGGQVNPQTDVLAVIAPYQLSQTQIFAIDQFLMRGGTLVLATSPFSTELAQGQLRVQAWDSGLSEWLAHYGIVIQETMVLDTQNAPFPAPIVRNSQGQEFQDVQVIDYPYFLDIRASGVIKGHPITSSLPQLTMAWASPISLQQNKSRTANMLLRSSANSWTSSSAKIMPVRDEHKEFHFPAGEKKPAMTVGVALKGVFQSWFADKPPPSGSDSDPNTTGINAVIRQSPKSSRIILYASNDFLDDQVLNALALGAGTQYLGPLALFMNTLDWAVQDNELLKIRSGGNFNRTLPAMTIDQQKIIEYLNYAAVCGLLLLLWLGLWLGKVIRTRHYAAELSN
jgi:ABC-2 type transport system permease protein